MSEFGIGVPRLAAIDFDWTQAGQVSVQSHFNAIPSLGSLTIHTKKGLYNMAITLLMLLAVLLHSGYASFLICQVPGQGHASSLTHVLVSFFKQEPRPQIQIKSDYEMKSQYLL